MMNKFVRHIGFQVRETGHSKNFIQLRIGLWDIAQFPGSCLTEVSRIQVL